MSFPDTILLPEVDTDTAEAIVAFLAEFGLESDGSAVATFHQMLAIEVARARAQETFPGLARAIAEDPVVRSADPTTEGEPQDGAGAFSAEPALEGSPGFEEFEELDDAHKKVWLLDECLAQMFASETTMWPSFWQPELDRRHVERVSELGVERLLRLMPEVERFARAHPRRPR